MQSHFPLRPIGGDFEDSQALLAVNPTRKAVIFIHGYSGDSLTTWQQFDILLPQETKSSGHDLYFYGYDGLYSDMVASSAIFANFLKSILKTPLLLIGRVLPGSVNRDQQFEYDEVIIVAHSLGAVIARWALLDLHDNETPGLNRFRMILFAPAHRGARVDRLAAAIGSGIPLLGFITTAFRFKSPLVEQLGEHSVFLEDLQQRTNDAILAVGKQPYLVAHCVCIAEYEKIVTNLKFAQDPPAIAIPKKDHTGLCKPNAAWRLPLDEVLRGL